MRSSSTPSLSQEWLLWWHNLRRVEAEHLGGSPGTPSPLAWRGCCGRSWVRPPGVWWGPWRGSDHCFPGCGSWPPLVGRGHLLKQPCSGGERKGSQDWVGRRPSWEPPSPQPGLAYLTGWL